MLVDQWFKPKKYPHIGLPLTIKDFKWVKKYVENSASIEKHSFLPFIHKTVIQRKYRANKIDLSRNPSNKRTRIVGKPKIRDIFYSSHLDSNIFSYYNYLLNESYEKFIEGKSFNECVVAYRKIADKSNGNKCNIDFAKTAFSYLHDRKQIKHSVIVADITSFFDNLNHKKLKKQWSKLLNVSTLPKDHYNVFKALTRIKYVEGEQLFSSYENTMIAERGVPNSSTEKEYKRVKLNHLAFSREKKAVSYCHKDEFIKKNLNLIISKNNSRGIPQGSPISATLANIYMIDFDQVVYDTLSSPSINGFYQRYSDDLIVICDQKNEDEILNFIRSTIYELTDLEIHPDKTKLYRFEEIEKTFKGFEIDESTKLHNYSKTLEYLGFSYDGSRVIIKAAGFSKFHRSMKRSLRKSSSLAKHSKNPDKKIFKSRLYKRFTHIGAGRKLIYRPSKENASIYLKTKEFYWGNYLSYVYKANSAMKSINNSDIIKKQSSKIWNRFNTLLRYHANSVDEFHKTSLK